MTKLLIVDDDLELSDMLARYLRAEQFIIDTVYDGSSAIDKIKHQHYDAIILDVMMPIIDGFEVLRNVRAYSDVPIIMLTAKGEDIDRIMGLEMGADDYLAKPFNSRELLARLRAILRRQHTKGKSKLTVGALTMDMTTREAMIKQTLLDLTSTEFNLLYALSEQVGRVVTKDRLSEVALGRTLEKYDRSIDMHMSNLRKKMVGYGLKNALVTVRGQGYQLAADH